MCKNCLVKRKIYLKTWKGRIRLNWLNFNVSYRNCAQDFQYKEEIQRLKDALNRHDSEEQEKSSEMSYKDGKLRHATVVIETLKNEKDELQQELNSKCDRLKFLEEKQRHQRADFTKLEENLHQKESMIRNLQDANAYEESRTIQKLREDLCECERELRLAECEAAFKKSSDEFKEQNDKILDESETEMERLLSENIKLKDRVERVENFKVSELEGMKCEISNLTSDLHQRDLAVATMTEKIQKMERELRNSHTEYDKAIADLHVMKAQLDAVRLENRHLKEASLHGEHKELDLYHSNKQFISDFQEDMKTNPRRHASSNLPVSQGSPDNKMNENPSTSRPSPFSDLDYEDPPPNQRLTSTFTPSGFADDRDPLKLSFGDIRGLGSDFERSMPSSRRSSITTNFVMEEKRREKELERLLEARLNDLKLSTHKALPKQ
ncbi:centrosomal protein of 63 kDa-like isoform X2 [Xenia sp. Carnegie-2017]|uniref:centrosomal protein of 63 kDa-like isoform X2 n=1 Tax=Xenia sp. Carnegie-2017 TaxID=2897299 RepID=UPI001F040000|nr:centrosomal protein of 63 kDa-like isoform X2 [Xenia sp. Carnegie-2017]